MLQETRGDDEHEAALALLSGEDPSLFRTLGENVSDVVMVVDRELRFTFAGGGGLAGSGWSPGDIVGHTLADIVSPERYALLAPRYEAALRGEPQQFGLEPERGNGHYRVRIVPHVRGGAVVGAVAISQDLSLLVHAAERERRLGAQFQLAFEQSPVGVALIGLDGDWVQVNQALCDLLGHSEAELLEKSFQDFIHPDDLAGDLAHVDQLLAGHIASYQTEKRYRTGVGTFTWVNLTLALIYGADGTPDHLVAHIKDINGRRRDAEAMAANERKYRAVVEGAGDGILMLSMPEGVILEANPAACSMLGFAVEALVGLTAAEVMPERSRVTSNARHGPLVAGETLEGLRSVVRHDGSLVQLETRTALIGPEHAVMNIRDVTARMAFEERMRDAQRMESLALIAGGVAHDFNNLLQLIVGSTSLVLSDLDADSPAGEQLRIVELAAQQASELTTQMLAYAGRGSGVIAPVQLSDMIEDMLPLIEATHPEGVSSIKLLAVDLPPFHGDPSQIRQVVLNLVMNAAEACRTGDAIVTSTGLLELGEAELADYRYSDRNQPGPYVFLTVEDTGCGMTPATLERMFDPFYTTKFTGRGLGLAGVLGIIRSHSGAIRVTSRPGVGTEITTIFPART
jgi:two-component system, cell cycle sensor histidine kinase and response regulator CckA